MNLIIHRSSSIEQLRSIPWKDGSEAEYAAGKALSSAQAVDEAIAALQMMG